MKRKVLALLTAGGLCLTLAALPAPAEALTDVSGDTALAVEVLTSLGIVSGYADGAYHPEDGLTRAQFCKLAVLAEGHGDQVSGSAYRTLFSDVAGSHWAAPYINLAYEEGLVSGYGDGSFGPDDPVTVGQAVTVALHLLGYTTEDVGPFWPEDYMSLGEKLGLLDGISANASHALTRGEAALLLYSMLSMHDRDGGDYIDKLCASKVADAVLLDVDAEGEDGTGGLVQVCTTQGVSYYQSAQDLPETLEGSRGTLLLDQAGETAGFLPDGTISRTLTLAEVDANGVTDTSGGFYSVSNSANVLLDDTLAAYSACWYDLDGRDTVTLYYNEKGVVDLVTASQATAYEGVLLSGYYEDASPNATSPDTITLLGLQLAVADSGRSSLSQFEVGDRITVTLNGEGEVVSAVSYSERQADLYGMLQNGQVTLTCGLTVKGTLTGSGEEGDLVRVVSTGMGTLSASPAEKTVSLSLDLTRNTLGSIPLAEDVAVYERVKDSPAVEIDLEDILVSTVSASHIDFYATNDQGEVNLLLLDDVTDNAYTYGKIYSWSETVGQTEEDSYTVRKVSLSNSSGTSQEYTAILSVTGGTMGGIAANAEGTVVGTAELTAVRQVSRADFDGQEAVVADGVQIPVSNQVEVYNSDTGNWITLAQAKAYTDTFTIYYSGTLGVDAVVRVIVTQ